MKHARQKIAWLIILQLWLLGLVVAGEAQNQEPQTPKNYLKRFWGLHAGLPNCTIKALVTDWQGFLWLGTENGLVRFDGQEFKTFNTTNTPLLKSNLITSLLVTTHKKLWIGTAGGGVTIYDGSHFQGLRGPTNPGDSFVQTMAEGSDNSVWIVWSAGNVLRVRTVAHHYTVEQLNPTLTGECVTAMLEDKQKNLWLGTNRGVTCLRNQGQTDTYNTKWLTHDYIYCIREDKNGHLWFGTDNGLKELSKIEENSTMVFKDWLSARVYDLLFLPTMVVATDSGVLRVTASTQEPKLEKLTGESAILSILSLAQGINEIIWCGTAGNGLLGLFPTAFRFYSQSDGLVHPWVKTIFQDKKGRVWVGTAGGLNRLDGKRFITFTRQQGLCSNDIHSLAEDGRGDLWIGTSRGLQCASFGSLEQPLTTYTTANGLTENNITVLHTDHSGELWIGTDGGGLLSYQNQRFIPFHHDTENRSQHYIYAMAEDNLQTLWVAPRKGLFRVHLKTHNLIPDTNLQKLQTYMIRDIALDWKGDLWLATAQHGILCWKDGRAIPFPGHSSLTRSGIYRILEDADGILWLTADNGLYAFEGYRLFYQYKASLQVISAPHLRYAYWDENNGLNSAVFSGGVQPAGWKMNNGDLWMPTSQGITVVNPTQTPRKNPDILVAFEKIVCAGQTYYNPDAVIHFASIQKGITFYWDVLNFYNVDNLQFRYNLSEISWGEGNRKEMDRQGWIGPSRVFTLKDIQPGKYRFDIFAGNEERGWSTRKASFYFIIEYQSAFSSTFFLIILVVLVVVSALVVHARNRWQKKMEIQRIFADDERYKTSALKPKEFKKNLNRLLTVMDTEKPYLDAAMTVAKMAERLEVSKEYVSQIINQKYYMNFNQFLNKYRIEEAKKRLLDPAENQFVVLKIAFEVGFNSKSTFNTAFKKFTGMSPSEYRDKFQPAPGPQK